MTLSRSNNAADANADSDSNTDVRDTVEIRWSISVESRGKNYLPN